VPFPQRRRRSLRGRGRHDRTLAQILRRFAVHVPTWWRCPRPRAPMSAWWMRTLMRVVGAWCSDAA